MFSVNVQQRFKLFGDSLYNVQSQISTPQSLENLYKVYKKLNKMNKEMEWLNLH